jgi:hypothetical protein
MAAMIAARGPLMTRRSARLSLSSSESTCAYANPESATQPRVVQISGCLL